MIIEIATDPLIFKVEGEGGLGGSIVGEILARCLARAGYYIQCSRAFPAEIMGGRAWFQIAISSRPITWWGGEPHLLMNDCKGGDWSVIYRSHSEGDGSTEKSDTVFQLSFSPLSVARMKGNPRSANLVTLGALAWTLRIPLGDVISAATHRLSRRGGAPTDIEVYIHLGYQKVEGEDRWIRWTVKPPQEMKKRLVLNGNEAIVLGALGAGVEFFCGYPITPASSILEMMLKQLPSLGGVALQTEDEIAALSACLGASFGGRKAMCATSGPGFALMAEMINLAVMAEIPITIVDVQRSGPATGQPSQTEQADLWYAIYGSPGESPRIVLAPKDVRDALVLTHQAVNLSERLQMPVVLLSDGALSNRIEAIDEPDWDRLTRMERATASELNGGFSRYEITEDGVSPVSVPGLQDLPFIAAGMEHNIKGQPSGEAFVHHQMTEKRWRKALWALKLVDSPLEKNGYPSSIAILGWGSTWGVIQEANRRLEKMGILTETAHLRLLSPLPEAALREWLKGKKWVIVPEGNRSGQLSRLIRHLTPQGVIHLAPQDHFEITIHDIVKAVMKVIEGEVLEIEPSLYRVKEP